jgi:hypothetical protein
MNPFIKGFGLAIERQWNEWFDSDRENKMKDFEPQIIAFCCMY